MKNYKKVLFLSMLLLILPSVMAYSTTHGDYIAYQNQYGGGERFINANYEGSQTLGELDIQELGGTELRSKSGLISLLTDSVPDVTQVITQFLLNVQDKGLEWVLLNWT